MTSPGQPQPPDTITVGSRYTQDITEENVRVMAKGGFTNQFTGLGLDWRGFLAGIFNQIAGAITDLISAFFGTYTGSDPNILAYQSSQRELQDRIELLDEVAGYATATIPSSYSIGTGGQPSGITTGTLLNFSDRIGPQKNATVSGAGITFDKPGTWRIECQVANGGIVTSVLGGQPRIVLDLQVWGKDGDPNALIARKFYTEEIPQKRLTATWSNTVVLPPEYFVGDNKPYVRVRGWHGFSSSVTMAYGDGFTSLTVNRWDIDTSGPLNTLPPDTPDI